MFDEERIYHTDTFCVKLNLSLPRVAEILGQLPCAQGTGQDSGLVRPSGVGKSAEGLKFMKLIQFIVY